MDDRELLDKAAQAMGTKYVVEHFGYYVDALSDDQIRRWNPLTNNGDALRLAVQLKLTVGHDMDFPTGPIVWIRQTGEFGGKYEWTEPHGADELAATRRAIVVAVAVIATAPANTATP